MAIEQEEKLFRHVEEYTKLNDELKKALSNKK
jgi:hypothetical protein